MSSKAAKKSSKAAKSVKSAAKSAARTTKEVAHAASETVQDVANKAEDVANDAIETTSRWWARAPRASFTRAKDGIMERWERLSGTGSKLQAGAAEGAVAFGHSARRAYRHIKAWGSDLEDQLKADWKSAGREADHAWVSVRESVRHGWENAADDLED